MSLTAADIVKRQVAAKPDCVLGLPTGSSPLGMYEHLIKLYNRGELDFSSVMTFNLDEYIGLDTDHPQSYHQFMEDTFFQQVNLKPGNTHMPKPDETDNLSGCQNYERKIFNAGGIDLQILGIGRNGHIGFNEPGTSFSSQTHVVQLHDETRRANARFFDSKDEVPKAAVTMGIKTIMRARTILLLCSGESKQEALVQLVCSTVDETFPASVLQLHPDVTVLTDKSACVILENKYPFKENELFI